MMPILTDPFTAATENQDGLDGYHTSSIWQGTDWLPATSYAAQQSRDAFASSGVDPVSGIPAISPEQPAPAQEANDLFSIPGALKFDGPVPLSVAQDMYEAKRDEIARNVAAEQAPQDFWNKAGRLGASFVASSLDPLNIAASFVPVVGEARYAEMLADAGGALGRLGVRAGIGAARGAAGQALLEPLNYLQARSEQDDYGAANALGDLAFGTALGSIFHAAPGLASDFFRDTVAGKIAAVNPELRDGAARTAVAQVADGQPVNVAPFFDAAANRTPDADLSQVFSQNPLWQQFRAENDAARDARLQQALGNLTHQPDDADIAVSDAATEAVSQAKALPDDPHETALESDPLWKELGARADEIATQEQGAPLPPRPEDLLQYLARQGGLRSDPELSAIEADKQFVGGAGMLVRKAGGLTLDRAREMAQQEGFPVGDDIPSLLDAIDSNRRGEDQFRDQDAAAADAYRAALAGRRSPVTAMDLLGQRAEGLGIEAGGMEPHELLAAVHEREALMAEGPAKVTHADTIESDIDQAMAGEDLPWEWNDGQSEARPQQGAAGSIEEPRGEGPGSPAEGAARGAGEEPGSRAQPPTVGREPDADLFDLPLTDNERAFAATDPQTREELLAAFDQTQAATNRSAAIERAAACLAVAGF